MSLFNLIKNELYKTFHKKGIYIVLIITTLYILLTNIIYNTKLFNDNEIESGLEFEITFATTMEEAGETNTEEYVYSKSYIETHEYAKSFGVDSWQRYIIINDSEYYVKTSDIIERIISYELKFTKDKNDYEEALKEKKELTNELKNMTWEDFVKNKKQLAEINLKNSLTQEEKNIYQAELNALNLRIKHNIKYGFDDYNEYLDIYESNLLNLLLYKNKKEESLTQEEKNILNEAKKEVAISKYKIENKIKEVPYNSNNYLYDNFLNEYSTMILVMIILVAGSIVSEEFSKGTIKLLLVKPFSRTKILLGKYITSLLMVLFSIVVIFIIQTIIGGLFFGFDSLEIPKVIYNYTTSTVESIHILKFLFFNVLAVLPQLVLLTTLAFSLSTIFINTSIATVLTIVGAFGSNIINTIAQLAEIEILKFFVTLNWDWSVYLFGGTSPYKGITFPFSIIICIIYLLIMLFVTFIIFKKRNIKNV